MSRRWFNWQLRAIGSRACVVRGLAPAPLDSVHRRTTEDPVQVLGGELDSWSASCRATPMRSRCWYHKVPRPAPRLLLPLPPPLPAQHGAIRACGGGSLSRFT